MKWRPIQDLPKDWPNIADQQLDVLRKVWEDQSDQLKEIGAYRNFLEKLTRKMAIETGVLERLYNIDRGITLVLVQEGIREALIPHGTTDRPVSEVVALIKDQEKAVEGLFSFVKRERELSISYIRELHQVLTEHQDYVDAIDSTGRLIKTGLLKGQWKRFPNNPKRPNGSVHEYAPPEQVDSEMEKLVQWHHQHLDMGVSPEVEAAWLHHRFTQIHPFQDGNGRVARCLASLVFIRAGWFPLVITREERADYINALENADQGELLALTDIFARAQLRAFRGALSLSDQAISEQQNVRSIVQSVLVKLRLEQEEKAELERRVEAYATTLHRLTKDRLEQVAREIRQALKDEVTDFHISVQYAAPDDDLKAGWYRYQIIETARKLDYYANLSGYKAWVNLTIDMNGLRTELLISFHYTGHELRGLMACSACAYHKAPAEEHGSSLAQDIEALTLEPFDLSYLDEFDKLRPRYENWLEQAIVAGLEYWRKSV